MRRPRSALALLLASALVLVACSDDDAADAPGTTEAGEEPEEVAEPVDFSGRGPYAVGQVDLRLDSGPVVAVFYPADQDEVPADAEPYAYSGEDILDPAISALLPEALSGEVAPADTWVEVPASGDGPFPLVLHSHGFSGNARFANQHNAAVASWGYVVAAVDHPERGLASILQAFLAGEAGGPSDERLDSDQLLEALDLLTDPNALSGTPVADIVDGDRVAAEGHSAGGSASGTAAYDERVDLWLGQAPSTPFEPGADLEAFRSDEEGGRVDAEALLAATQPPGVPSLVIAAEGDTIIPLERVRGIFDWLAAPKRLAVIAGSGHAVFVDPCVPIREDGGLAGFVEALGLDPAEVPLVELGENGCLPADVDPVEVWGLVDHLTVAQLEATLGDDPAVGEASLERSFLDETFPGLLLDLAEG
ncbi:MAG: alpha/beta hydrolase family protein [Actinomycetota bacterium]